MARAPAAQPAGRRTAAAPPPAAAEPANIYEEVWDAVTQHNSSFSAPGERESDQGFLKRLTKAVSDLPHDVKMSPDAEAWYDTASRQFEAGNDIDEPPGFSDGGDEQQAQEEEEQPQGARASNGGNGAAQPSAAQQASRSAGAERLRQYRQNKAAEATPAAAPAGRRRGAPAAAPAAPTGRRGATQAAAPATPPPAGRRGAAAAQPAAEAGTRGRRAAAAPAAPAPAPRRSTAPAGASRRPTPVAAGDDAGTSIARFARLHIIANPNVTLDDLIAAAEAQGYNPTRSTMAGNLTFMRNAIDVVKETGHWRD